MSSWQPFRGEYEKTFYQIRFPDGEVRKHCFPNAGYMHALDGSGLMWSEKSQIEFKRCDCGEKWSGCSEMETRPEPQHVITDPCGHVDPEGGAYRFDNCPYVHV